MVNYSQGKIYKIEPICDHEEGEIYIGSTAQDKLCQRWRQHTIPSVIKKSKKTASYILFEKYGVENCRIILIEEVNAKSKDELISREAFHIRSTACVNKNIPGRTDAMYYIDKKKEINEKVKQYRINHKETVNARDTQYYNNNKDARKQNQRQYYATHKVAIKERENMRQLNAKNKKLLELSKDAEQGLDTIVSQDCGASLCNVK